MAPAAAARAALYKTDGTLPVKSQEKYFRALSGENLLYPIHLYGIINFEFHETGSAPSFARMCCAAKATPAIADCGAAPPQTVCGKDIDVARGSTYDNKADEAYELIKAKIIGFTYPPNSPITELDLCEKLNMSRTPVRIAIARLVADGFIVEQGPKKNLVADTSVDSFVNIYQIREALDLLSVRAACLAWQNRSEIDALRDVIAQQQEMLGSDIVDSRAFLRLDKAYHSLIAGMTRNGLLRKQLSYIYDLYWRYNFYGMHVTGTRYTVAEHQRIADANELRDPELCASRMQEHLVAAKEHILVGIAKGFKPQDMNNVDTGYVLLP